MSQREVVIKGGPNNTAAFVTGQQELLVRLGSEAVGLATESTLQAVLTTLQAFTEYEAKFVLDANNEVFLEVRVWNEDTGTWAGTPTYYRPGQTTPASPAPVAPIVYADNAPILANILTEIQSITYAEDTPHVSGGNGVFVLGVRNDLGVVMTSNDGDYSPIAVTDKGAVKVDAAISFPSSLDVNVFDGSGTNPITSTTVGPVTGLDVNIIGTLNQNNDQVQIYGSDLTAPVATDTAGHLQVDILTIPEVEVKNDSGNPIPVNGTVAATQSGTWNIASITGPVALPTGAATETTLAAINTKLTPVVRTHNTVLATTGPTAIGSVPAGSLRGSVLNAGSAAGTWNGISLPAGVSIPWDAVGPKDTYGAIAYDATGTTFIIEYTT